MNAHRFRRSFALVPYPSENFGSTKVSNTQAVIGVNYRNIGRVSAGTANKKERRERRVVCEYNIYRVLRREYSRSSKWKGYTKRLSVTGGIRNINKQGIEVRKQTGKRSGKFSGD